MFTQTLLDKINNLILTEISDDDKNIGKYILQNWKKIFNMSIRTISNELKISPTKVTRFCWKLKLSGFSELKLRLKDLNNTVTIDGRPVNVINEIKSNENLFFQKYYEINLKSIKQQYQYFINKDLNYIVEKLIKAKKIYLFAFNLSYNISRNFCQRLRWLNKNIISECDSISIDTYLNMIQKDDLVFLITISGQNQLIKKLAKYFYSKTPVIGIIDQSCSYKEFFDDYLLINTNESELWNINSIKAQLTIQLLDFLYAKVINKIT